MHSDNISRAAVCFLEQTGTVDLNRKNIIEVLEKPLSLLMDAKSSCVMTAVHNSLCFFGEKDSEKLRINDAYITSCLVESKGEPVCVSEKTHGNFKVWLFPVYTQKNVLLGGILLETEMSADCEIISAAEKIIFTAVSLLNADGNKDILKGAGDSASVISHEFKTPLTIALSSVQLIERRIARENDETLKSDIRKYILYTEQNLYKILRLADNLIDISYASETDAQSFEYVDLSRVIETISDEIKPYLCTHQLNFCFENESHSPVCIQCNLRKIERVVLNLVANAAAHTPENGRITIRLSEHDNRVGIDVENDGADIPEKDFPHLFERFWRGEGECRGSGLGLYIIKCFVEMHGGSVSAENRAEGGARFCVDLPKFQMDVSGSELSSVSFFGGADAVRELVRIEMSEWIFMEKKG